MLYVSNQMIHFISDKCRVPDHSIIVCEIIISDYKRDNSLPVRKKQLCNRYDCNVNCYQIWPDINLIIKFLIINVNKNK